MAQVVEDLRAYMPGWRGYFALAHTPGVFRELDQWLRHRLRALHLEHWKRGSTMFVALRQLGASPSDARIIANNSRCWWPTAASVSTGALPIKCFDGLAVPRLA